MTKATTICGIFDLPRLAALKKEYSKAVAVGQENFVFEGNDYSTAFARYLTEYLDTALT
jgi:hypothetical protein